MKEKYIFWVFAKSNEMRDMLNYYCNIIFIPFIKGLAKLNPPEPPYLMQPMHWAVVLWDAFCQAFWLREASKALLLEASYYLYNKFIPLGYYFSFFDLYNHIAAKKYPLISRYARSQESILNRLTGLKHSVLSSTLDCSRGHISPIVLNHTVFEIQHLTIEEQVFFVNYLLSFLFFTKMNVQTNTRHFVFIDDSNAIFQDSYEKRHDVGLPIIHHLVTTVRKAAIHLIPATQTPNQFAASMHSNSSAKIMLPLDNGDDISCMLASMGITDPEQQKYCYTLQPREAVVKLQSKDPFIVRVPEVNI